MSIFKPYQFNFDRQDITLHPFFHGGNCHVILPSLRNEWARHFFRGGEGWV